MAKTVNFTAARENLSTLIDEVRKSGRSVTILKRGQPAAVLVNCEVFDKKIAKPNQKPWRLAGSMKVVKGVDIDASILEVRESHRRAWGKRMAQLARDLSGDR
jgi:prevent-host-death family protein